MADQQEQFSYEEYKTYKRVAKMLAEDDGEPGAEGQGIPEPEKKKPIFDDPADNPNAPHHEHYRTREAHLNRKMNYTDDEKAFAKQLVKNIINC